MIHKTQDTLYKRITAQPTHIFPNAGSSPGQDFTALPGNPVQWCEQCAVYRFRIRKKIKHTALSTNDTAEAMLISRQIPHSGAYNK